MCVLWSRHGVVQGCISREVIQWWCGINRSLHLLGHTYLDACDANNMPTQWRFVAISGRKVTVTIQLLLAQFEVMRWWYRQIARDTMVLYLWAENKRANQLFLNQLLLSNVTSIISTCIKRDFKLYANNSFQLSAETAQTKVNPKKWDSQTHTRWPVLTRPHIPKKWL